MHPQHLLLFLYRIDIQQTFVEKIGRIIFFDILPYFFRQNTQFLFLLIFIILCGI